MVTAGRPYYAPPADMDFGEARRAMEGSTAPTGATYDIDGGQQLLSG
jgi:hypothetical protein